MCGVEFIPNKFVGDRAKFCSLKCRSKLYYNKYYTHFEWKKPKLCEICGKEYIPQKSISYTCSRKCCMKRNRILHKEEKRLYDSNWQKEDRKNNPEKYRFRAKQRRHLLREASGLSGRNFNSDFTLIVWEQLKKDCDYTCKICNKSEPGIKLTIDHIIPLSKGGKHDKDNIQPLCHSCNSRKKDNLGEFYSTH